MDGLSNTEEPTSLGSTATLPIDRLGEAIHAAKRVGGPWGGPCGYPIDPSVPYSRDNWVQIEYDTDPMGEFDCLCRSMAGHLIEIMGEQSAKRIS